MPALGAARTRSICPLPWGSCRSPAAGRGGGSGRRGGSPRGPPSAAATRAAAGKERRLLGAERRGEAGRGGRRRRGGERGWSAERRGGERAMRGAAAGGSLAGSACGGSAAASASVCWPPCWGGSAGAAGTAPTSSWTAASALPREPRGPAARRSASKWSAAEATWWKLCSLPCCPTAPCPCEYGPQYPPRERPGGRGAGLWGAGAHPWGSGGTPWRGRARALLQEPGKPLPADYNITGPAFKKYVSSFFLFSFFFLSLETLAGLLVELGKLGLP